MVDGGFNQRLRSACSSPSPRRGLRLGLLFGILLGWLLFISAACTAATETALPDSIEEIPVDEQPTGAADAQPAETSDAVAELLATLTTEQKVGQLLMPMINGTASETTGAEQALNLAAHGYATPAEIVAAYNLGGVVYLANNVSSAAELRGLSAQLQAAAADTTGIGLMVAIDQEGGQVTRLTDEVTAFPPAATFAGDPDLAREAGYVTGQQVQQQGINVVLAPVADVVEPGRASFIGDRSFGGDPAAVAGMVAAAVEGLQGSGVAAAVKHWPGHGATGVDSHERLPTVNVDRALWDQRERLPFVAAIEKDVAIVMVGHLAFPELDPSSSPATVSPVLVDGLLRQELGYDGVVMTDALNMGAVAAYGRGELAVGAVAAGVDVILVPPSLPDAFNALVAAVEDNTLTEGRLDAAVTRILRLKDDLGLLPNRAAAAEG